jgi:Skp family chaperone for outer membrane proteins
MSIKRSVFHVGGKGIVAASLLGAAVISGMALHSVAVPSVRVEVVSQPTRIAVVDIGRLMNSLEELKARNEAVQIRGAALADRLKQLESQIKDIEAELKDMIPRDDVKRRGEKLAEQFELRATLEARAKAYQQLINLENGDILMDLYTKVQEAAGNFARREGFDMIFLDDRAIRLPRAGTNEEYNDIIQRKRIIYANDSLDITEALLTQMNNAYTAGLNRPRN